MKPDQSDYYFLIFVHLPEKPNSKGSVQKWQNFAYFSSIYNILRVPPFKKTRQLEIVRGIGERTFINGEHTIASQAVCHVLTLSITLA